jgi:hypothetical protein
MKSQAITAFHQAVAAATDSRNAAVLTEEGMFRARAEELRKQQPGRLAHWLRSLVPAPLAERLAAKRAEHELFAAFRHLEGIGSHLLDDIGVEKAGPSDYLVRTDDIGTIRALRPASAPLLPEFLPPRRLSPARIAG